MFPGGKFLQCQTGCLARVNLLVAFNLDFITDRICGVIGCGIPGQNDILFIRSGLAGQADHFAGSSFIFDCNCAFGSFCRLITGSIIGEHLTSDLSGNIFLFIIKIQFAICIGGDIIEHLTIDVDRIIFHSDIIFGTGSFYCYAGITGKLRHQQFTYFRGNQICFFNFNNTHTLPSFSIKNFVL